MGGVSDGASEVFELCLAEVAELLHDGVACPAFDGVVEREVPLGGDGEVVLPFVVGGRPLGNVGIVGAYPRVSPLPGGSPYGIFKNDEEALGGGKVEPGGAVFEREQLFLVGGGVVDPSGAALVDFFGKYDGGADSAAEAGIDEEEDVVATVVAVMVL